MKKTVSLLIIVAMVVCMFSGCELSSFASRAYHYLQNTWENIVNDITEDNSWQQHMHYTLSNQMVTDFYALLEESEALAIAGEDMDAIDQITNRLDEAYMEFIDQNQIAYVLYCRNQSDEKLSRQYLESAEILEQVEEAYNEMAKTVYLSETPARDMLFEDWTQLDISLMLLRNEQVALLEQRNTEILTQFRALDGDTWQVDMISLYNEQIGNNNEIAEIYGFENYYEYASLCSFQRDYEIDRIRQMRGYCAGYLAPLCQQVTDLYYESYNQLNEQDKALFTSILHDDYDQNEKNYVLEYIGQLPASAADAMTSMFEDDRVVLTDSKDSYQGAFTTFVDYKPFCYYGRGYQDSLTILHEMGHYYGSGNYDPWSVPIDLAETHSQANEFLFINYLENQIPQNVYTCVKAYHFMQLVSTIVVCMMVDEFEYLVYTHENAGELTLEEYDAIMESVAQNYGGIEYVEENITDIQYYWKLVALENPVYYLSYAASGIAAADLYTVAVEDQSLAYDIYCKLVEEGDGDQGFLWNISNAGLSGPFEEEVYKKLTSVFTN